jgi:hypothetical protein
MPSNAGTIWNDYAHAWTAVSDHERRQILARVLAANVTYVTPTLLREGHEGVIEDIEGFQAKVPGGQFVLRSESAHHSVALIEWELLLPDGKGAALGHDVIHLSPDGQIDSIATFAKAASERQNV